ncbi:putative inorganic phosphate cotransporter [Microplitis demolitor]|uniref:putative inorganic phosphate cotransporter n=1 Tax=Microplitis demolitor TaxID=69319 RepID=UPI0004CCD5B5|nr:putative inorganic phosphate cotransporter [Microplitis demolitor]
MSSRLSTRRISRAENMRVPPNPPKASIGCRHIQVLLLTLGFFCCYAVRVALSISLVAMVKADSANPNFEEFDWSDSVQNTILSSFFWGYVITHIPGGELAQRFGAHKFLCFAVGICGIVTALIPLAATYGGWEAVIVLRVLTGACQGVIPPCMHTILSKWVPVDERGRAGSCTYSGGWLGNVIALLSCGVISGSSIGWPGSFYIWGGIATLWSITYYFLGKESPADHRGIPLDEKEYIEISLGVTETTEPLKTPWTAIFTSIPVWALLIAQCSQAWGFWMLLTKTPAYMNSAMGYKIQENGIVSALPYLAAWLLGFPISFTADKLVKGGYTSLESIRKIANTIGECIPALALIGLSFITSEHRNVAVGVLIMSVAFNVAVFSGHQMNHMDLSPNFAGTLMGITNAAANICGIMAPLIYGVIVSDPTDITQWRKVYILSAGIYIAGNLAFVFFGKATVQPWNDGIKPKLGNSTARESYKIQEEPMPYESIKKDNDKDIITTKPPYSGNIHNDLK